MNTVQVSDNELKEMKELYLEEYAKASARIKHITSVLLRLGVDLPANETFKLSVDASSANISNPTKKGSVSRKKPGRKSKWEMMVMKRMRQLDKPVTYDQLTDEIMAFNKISPVKRTSTKQAVINVVFRLRNRDHKLDTFSMGTREKYIALKNWFDAQGKIKKDYAAKVVIPGRENKAKKRPDDANAKTGPRKT